MFKEYGNVIKMANLKDYNTYNIECICDYLIIVNNIVKLTNLIKYLNDNESKYMIIGGGSNIIFPDKYKGIVIKLNFNELSINKNIVEAGASIYLNKLVSETVNNNLSGLEWAGGIPGTLGGSVINNAGAYNDEIMNYVKWIEVLENNKVKIIKKNEIEYSYRNTSLKKRNLVVLKVVLDLKKGKRLESLSLINERLKRRLDTQPLEYPSAGSVFRNPLNDYAGRLIEEAGLKGQIIGGAKISEKHANFIVNYNKATSEDIKALIKLAHDTVLEKNNLDLQLEQQIID